MFQTVSRANDTQKHLMRMRAEEIATENNWIFTGLLDPSPYTVEFISHPGDEPFYGWAIKRAVEGYSEYEFVFGSGQVVFSDETGGEYIITDEDYYDTIGAGI